MENMVLLQLQQAEKIATFPPTCPVYIQDQDELSCTISHGTVTQVFLQINGPTSLKLFYQINVRGASLPSYTNKQVKHECSGQHLFQDVHLRYRSGCPVYISNHTNSNSTKYLSVKARTGIILGSCDIPDGDDRGIYTSDRFWYSVQILDDDDDDQRRTENDAEEEKENNLTVLHEVSPSQIRYRPLIVKPAMKQMESEEQEPVQKQEERQGQSEKDRRQETVRIHPSTKEQEETDQGSKSSRMSMQRQGKETEPLEETLVQKRSMSPTEYSEHQCKRSQKTVKGVPAPCSSPKRSNSSSQTSPVERKNNPNASKVTSPTHSSPSNHSKKCSQSPQSQKERNQQPSLPSPCKHSKHCRTNLSGSLSYTSRQDEKRTREKAQDGNTKHTNPIEKQLQKSSERDKSSLNDFEYWQIEENRSDDKEKGVAIPENSNVVRKEPIRKEDSKLSKSSESPTPPQSRVQVKKKTVSSSLSQKNFPKTQLPIRKRSVSKAMSLILKTKRNDSPPFTTDTKSTEPALTSPRRKSMKFNPSRRKHAESHDELHQLVSEPEPPAAAAKMRRLTSPDCSKKNYCEYPDCNNFQASVRVVDLIPVSTFKSPNKVKSKVSNGEPRKSSEQRLQDLSAFKTKHGHCNVAYRDDLLLYRWCRRRRVAYEAIQAGSDPKIKFKQEMIDALNALGFDWTYGRKRKRGDIDVNDKGEYKEINAQPIEGAEEVPSPQSQDEFDCDDSFSSLEADDDTTFEV